MVETQSALGEMRYYHLVHKKPDMVLPSLIKKSIERGMNAVVKSENPNRLSMIDKDLWKNPPESFLPHLMVNALPQAELSAQQRQEYQHCPLLLTMLDSVGAFNDAKILFLLDHAAIDQNHNYQRICRLFDGNDQAELSFARQQWVLDRDARFQLSYWQQTDEGWQQKL